MKNRPLVALPRSLGVGSVAPGSALHCLDPLVEGAQIQPPQQIPDGAHRVILRHQAIRVDRPQDDLVAVDGLQPQLRFGRREGWEGAADCSFSPSTSTVCSASMRPRFPPSDRRSTPNRQGALVLDHPLDLLALLQLQRFGQGGRGRSGRTGGCHRPAGSVALSIGSPWPENCTTSHSTSQENFFKIHSFGGFPHIKRRSRRAWDWRFFSQLPSRGLRLPSPRCALG